MFVATVGGGIVGGIIAYGKSKQSTGEVSNQTENNTREIESVKEKYEELKCEIAEIKEKVAKLEGMIESEDREDE